MTSAIKQYKQPTSIEDRPPIHQRIPVGGHLLSHSSLVQARLRALKFVRKVEVQNISDEGSWEKASTESLAERREMYQYLSRHPLKPELEEQETEEGANDQEDDEDYVPKEEEVKDGDEDEDEQGEPELELEGEYDEEEGLEEENELEVGEEEEEDSQLEAEEGTEIEVETDEQVEEEDEDISEHGEPNEDFFEFSSRAKYLRHLKYSISLDLNHAADLHKGDCHHLIRRLKSLQNVSYNDTLRNRYGIGYLPEMLRIATNLKSFLFRGFRCIDVDAVDLNILMRSLTKSKHFTHLDLDFEETSLSNDALSALARGLGYLNTLIHLRLDLSSADITEKEAKILEKSLGKLSKLKTLYLDLPKNDEVVDEVFNKGQLLTKLNSLEDIFLEGAPYTKIKGDPPLPWDNMANMCLQRIRLPLNCSYNERIRSGIAQLPYLRTLVLEFSKNQDIDAITGVIGVLNKIKLLDDLSISCNRWKTDYSCDDYWEDAYPEVDQFAESIKYALSEQVNLRVFTLKVSKLPYYDISAIFDEIYITPKIEEFALEIIYDDGLRFEGIEDAPVYMIDLANQISRLENLRTLRVGLYDFENHNKESIYKFFRILGDCKNLESVTIMGCDEMYDPLLTQEEYYSMISQLPNKKWRFLRDFALN